MPFAGFLCRPCGARLGREEALEHIPWAHEGYGVPPAALEMCWRSEGAAHRKGTHLSPSMAGGCMREHAIKRTFDWWLEPSMLLKANRGTLYHEQLAKYSPPGWLPEVHLPNMMQHEATGGVRVCDDHVMELELWPGIWLSGTVDAMRGDGAYILDYKSQDSPVPRWNKADKCYDYSSCTDYGLSDHWVLQVNLYGRMVQRLWGLEEPPQMDVWRCYDGMKDTARIWRRLPVALMPEQELRAAVEDDFRMFVQVMQIADVEERKRAIADMPLQGRTQLSGQKCSRYCNVKPECDSMLPVEERW